MLRTPIVWVRYGMFVLVAATGLVVTAQVAPIAKDYGVGGLPVNFLFITSTGLVVAGIVDNILNGLARPTCGWVSDQTKSVILPYGASLEDRHLIGAALPEMTFYVFRHEDAQFGISLRKSDVIPFPDQPPR